MVFIIAEVGSVHDGSFGNACRLVETAAQCGANAIKFQTHIAAAETLPNAPSPPYFQAEPRYDYFQRTAFTPDQWAKLAQLAKEKGLVFLSSPFCDEAVDLLESIGITQYKIPSGEVTNLPLLERIAATGKPVLLSSGMSSWTELDRAVDTFKPQSNPLTVMQCTSEYPCSPERVGLNVMQQMATRYGLPVGLSDHTLTPHAAYAAICLGATVIEKHLTFSRLMYGSDAKHAIEPDEFSQMVHGIQTIDQMLQSPVDKDDLTAFEQMKMIFQKSVVAQRDIPSGTRIDRSMLAMKKPGTGIPADQLHRVVGQEARRDIARDTPLAWDDLSAAP